jgi:hypothetical protein
VTRPDWDPPTPSNLLHPPPWLLQKQKWRTRRHTPGIGHWLVGDGGALPAGDKLAPLDDRTAQHQDCATLIAASNRSKAWAANRQNAEKADEAQPAAEGEAQVRERQAARGEHLHGTDTGPPSIAKVTGDRPGDSSAGQQALSKA